MARYRRRYTRVVRPRKKWASNMLKFSQTTVGTATAQVGQYTLVKNSFQNATPTPVIVKTGNFRLQGDAYVTPSAANATIVLTMYIMYIPEGISINDAAGAQNIVQSHPEWIMGWKVVTANRTTTTNPDNSETFSFSSRLKRNLNSGDEVKLICLAEGTPITEATFSGMCQYWTCAN